MSTAKGGGAPPAPEQVRAELGRLDMSQSALAKVLNMQQPDISQWLNHEAKRKSSNAKFVQLTAALTDWYNESVGSSSRAGAKRKRADTATDSDAELGEGALQVKKQKERRARRVSRGQGREDQGSETEEDEDEETESAGGHKWKRRRGR